MDVGLTRRMTSGSISTRLSTRSSCRRMGGRHMERVFDVSVQKRSALLLMLAIAKHADDEGFAWPSNRTIARNTGLSERSVRNLTRAAQASGELRVHVGKGPGGSNLYQIAVMRNQALCPANFTPRQNLPSGKQRKSPRQNAPIAGAAVAPESVSESVNESRKRAIDYNPSFRRQTERERRSYDRWEQKSVDRASAVSVLREIMAAINTRPKASDVVTRASTPSGKGTEGIESSTVEG